MKKLVILGAGESGVGAAILAKKNGYEVLVSDNGVVKSTYRDVLLIHDIKFEESGHDFEKILQADEIVKSPGIPEEADVIKEIRKHGINIVSEIEFAGRYTDAKIIGITGSNGKTTTTHLIYHMLKKAGLNVGIAGNVGNSFAQQVAEMDHEYYVLELSSFQLEGMVDFKIDYGLLLNITPDHLDRYDNDINKYADAKFRILQNQTKKNYFIYCDDDDLIKNEIQNRNIESQLIPFSVKTNLKRGASIDQGNLEINIDTHTFSMNTNELALHGTHNFYNSMAAGIIGRLLDIRNEIIRDSLSNFENVPHRLENVLTIHGIKFMNDSKATNVNAAWYALESMNNPVVWILGGTDKGNDYSLLKEMALKKVRAIVCLGLDNTKIKDAFGNCVDLMVETASMKDAVKSAYHLAKKDDIVLLSPACASFDLFENYEDRGDQFKDAVKSL